MDGPTVDDDLVRRLAALARLRVSDAQLPELRQDLGHILAYVETLRKVTAPQVGDAPEDAARAREREDVPRADDPRPADLLAGAPELRGTLIATPGLDRGGA